MDTLMNNWLIAAILFPVAAGFFKTEIGNLLKAWSVYRSRAFDVDGNPATSGRAQIMNGATGVWVDVTLVYKFSLSAKKRGVYLTYPNGAKEKVGLMVWAGFRKRMPPVERTNNGVE